MTFTVEMFQKFIYQSVYNHYYSCFKIETRSANTLAQDNVFLSWWSSYLYSFTTILIVDFKPGECMEMYVGCNYGF